MAARKRADIAVGLLVGLMVASPTHAGDVDKGKTIYAARCAFCHGTSGKGDGPAGAALKPAPADLTTPTFWATATADTLRTVIENGKPNTGMVSFKRALSAEELGDVVAFLLSLKP